MSLDLPSKAAQQEAYLKSLKVAAADEKSHILLRNSGFAAAVIRDKKAVSIKFAR